MAIRTTQLQSEAFAIYASLAGETLREGPCQAGGLMHVQLSGALTQALRVTARQHGSTVLSTLISAWVVLLQRLTAQEEIELHLQLGSRRLEQRENQIGAVDNSETLCLRFKEDETIQELLKKVEGGLAPTRRSGAAPSSIMVSSDFMRPDGRLNRGDNEGGGAMCVSLSDGEDGASLECAGKRGEYESLERVIACWERLLEGMVTDIGLISELPMLPAVDRERVLYTFNDTTVPYPKHRLAHEMFEAQAKRTPDAVALVQGQLRITYANLNGRANQVAWCLRDKGVGPDQLVGLCAERSVELVVGLIGILKAGGAYLPLDPIYPTERLAYMLRDAAPQILLMEERLKQRLPRMTAEVIILPESDLTEPAERAKKSQNVRNLQMSSRSLAYVIYTSGSTGDPKGVSAEHRGLVNRIQAQADIGAFAQSDICCHKTSIGFVDAVFEILGPLSYGCSLVLASSEITRDPRQLAALIDSEQITRLVTVPSLAQSMVESLQAAQSLKSLRGWALSGEEAKIDLIRRLHEQVPTCTVTNLYGSSEVAADVTYHVSRDSDDTRVPIGRPMGNTHVYILDCRLRPVPIGVEGEIYIGGVGVARGYHNRPGLTAERFIADPFTFDVGRMVYRSGDLGRWRSDGTIEYLGRIDRQVKIRGFRIELGEIEAQLERHPRVKHAVVVAREDVPGQMGLVAYVTSRGDGGPKSEELRAHLVNVVPEYMLPFAFVTMQAFPRTLSGKLDRRMLPVPRIADYVVRPYAAPQGELEEILASLWLRLLRVQRVGRQDNFFELGGHSLLIVQMLENLRQVGLYTEARDVFESPTLEQLAHKLTRTPAIVHEVPPNLIPSVCDVITPQILPLVDLEAEQIARIAESVPGGIRNIQDIYPLTPLQEGMLFHYLLDQHGGDTYVEPILLSLSSRERLNALIVAFEHVISRHDVLRTAVQWEQLPRPVQIVHRQVRLPVQNIELKGNGDPENIGDWLKLGRRKLDLGRAPLMQLQIAEDGHSGRWYALLQIHHLIGDDVSLHQMLGEVAMSLDGRGGELREPGAYRDHVAQALAADRAGEVATFFRGKLGEIDEPSVPFNIVSLHADVDQIVEIRSELSPELARRLRVQARGLGVSAATIFHAAWGLVVARTSGRDDVVFGTVLLGRLKGTADAQQALGLFVNTLPLRLRLVGTTARELVEQSQAELVELLTYEQASLAVAQRCSGIGGASPLFSALLNYRHGAVDLKSQLAETGGVQLLARADRTNYPLTLSVDDVGKEFTLTVQTDPRIDPSRVTAYVHMALTALIEALEQAPHTPALMLRILPENEHEQVIKSFNASDTPYPQSKLVHQLFEDQVERTPGAIALMYDGHSVTYAALNRRANQLARYLKGRGVAPEQLVALCVERSVEMVVGILGILKAGGAYVPLDPGYPVERLQYMLETAAARVVLTQHAFERTLPTMTAEVIALDRDWGAISQLEDRNLDSLAMRLTSRNLAYVIYTSGSTGQPKGAMNEHRGVVNRLLWMQERYGLNDQDRVLQKTPFSFDVSVWEFFWTLMTGARLILASPQGHKDPLYLRKLIEETGVTTLHFVPSMLRIFLNQHQVGWCPSVRRIVCSGEELVPTLLNQCLERLPHAGVSNLYGPTEAAVDVTAWECHLDQDSNYVPIGQPITNVQMYVLNAHGQPLPIGVAGEIHIGGVGVGRGYLNRPELTAERFVADPFNRDVQARLYKTGDLGRWRPEGMIEYIGRNDSQVKIRGFRIELREIEVQLSRHARVKDAVVVSREDVAGEKRLVAYVTYADGGIQSVEDLRAWLSGSLPEYMVPSAVVTMERLPLSPNGKLDRRALPAPDLAAYATRHFAVPEGEVEEILAAIWQELLKIERIGRQDNFFALGGHSLLIVQMMERLSRIGLSAELRTVYETPTLAALATVLTNAATGPFDVPPSLIPLGCERIDPEMIPMVTLDREQVEYIVQSVAGGAGNIQDIYPLVPLQEGILFHHLLDDQGDTYATPMLLSLSSREALDQFIHALQRVIDRHDSLRTAVLWEQLPRPVQVVYRHASLIVNEIVLESGRDSEKQLRELMRPELQRVDLRRAPMMQLRIAAEEGGRQWYALLQLHHIICDHESVKTLVSEVRTHISGRAQTLARPLPYRNHVAHALAQARTHDAEAFFRSKLREIDESTAPFGLLDVHGDGSRIDEARRVVGATLADRIRGQARRSGISAATLFHAAWALVVSHTSGRDDVVFGSVLLARLQGSADSERMLGMFVNTLPLRLKLGALTARQLVDQTQRELMELLRHAQASLAVAQRCSGVSGSAPLFSALLNYRHSGIDLQSELGSAVGGRVLVDVDRTNYPVTLSVDDLGEGFRITAQTDRRVDPRRVIDYVSTAMESLLEALEQSPQTPALALATLPLHERYQVIDRFNPRGGSFPQEKLIHEQFEEQVKRAPKAPAVVFEGHLLTYGELNARSNQLARYLVARGIGPGQLVALCVERSLEMVVGVLAIFKAGAAYLPLDPTYPSERLAYMQKDAKPSLLLTQERLREKLPPSDGHVIALDTAWTQIKENSVSNLSRKGLSQYCSQLAYIIYTSGSTGEPKGVMVEHSNVMRLFAATKQDFNFSETDVWTLFHSIGFDFSVWELWGALLFGGKVVVVPYLTARSPQDFYRLLCEEGVTVLSQTPSAFLQLIDAQKQIPAPKHALRVVVFGGEPLDVRTLRPWLGRNSATRPRLVNMYGITETTVHVTYRSLTKEEIDAECHSGVGRPISDLRVYVLDQRRQPVGIGVAGEIYVCGAGVARGYLNRTTLTAERFLADPFSTAPGARMYKSGDLGRWRADGQLEHLGRNDNQVKVRGFRIELGEIEARLALHAHVREVAVVAREDTPGEKRLVAYITPGDSGVPSVEELRTHLRTALPEYMIPSAFVVVACLPLTVNGKLDRRALPAPQHEAYSDQKYEAPRGEVEMLLARIWQELLRVERVGRENNFFELGGHSLLIVQMRERLRREGWAVSVRGVYESPSLKVLAEVLTTEAAVDISVPPNLIPPVCGAITPEMLTLVALQPQHIDWIVRSVPGGARAIQDIYPLTPLQEGMLFHAQLNDKGGDVYVVTTLLSVPSRNVLDVLIAALQVMIDQHDILRTAVLWEKLPQPLQVVYREATLPVEVVALDPGCDLQEQMKEWMRPERHRLDLRRAPLMRLQVAAHPDGDQWFALLEWHHFANDHDAFELLSTEVKGYVCGHTKDQSKPLPFRNHVAQALAHAQLHDAQAFFRDKLQDIDEPTAPFGLLDVHGDGSRIDGAHLALEPALAQRIRARSRLLGVSAATLFHSAWALVVSRTSGRDDVVFGTVLLGRLQGSAGAQRILGMFINTLPLRLRLRDVTVAELVAQTQRELVELLNYEQASLAVARRCSGISGSAPLFSALLNYRHNVVNVESEFASVGMTVLAMQGKTNYPINLSVDDNGEGFELVMETDRRVDPHQMLGYVGMAIQSLVDSLESAPNRSALTLPVLPKSERDSVVEAFNTTRAPCFSESLIHVLFEEQVARTPNSLAVVYGSHSLTYAELNGRANQLARHLRDKGIGPDRVVGICIDRSLDLMVGVLGILKAGGAYVPLDPNQPADRLEYLLNDAKPAVLLIQERLRERLPRTTAAIIALDGGWNDIVWRSAGDLDGRGAGLCPHHLAYVIYTSGSTGRPKGVMIEHRSVVNLWQGLEHLYRQSDDCRRIALNASFNFDASVQQFVHLLSGRAVFVIPQASRTDALSLLSFLDANEIDGIDCTPSQLKSWVSAGLLANACPRLRLVLVGGEAIDPELWSRLAHCREKKFYNVYGPTECTVDATVAPLQGCTAGPNIGRPMQNRRVYILDGRGQCVPVGAVGEIHIGGAGIGRGYLNRPSLTAERFLPDHFSADREARMYRTGDLGRWRTDGTIEYCGRNDDQVKIRGFRIELGEIETRLLQHSLVKEVVVLAREDAPGDKRLVAYIVPGVSPSRPQAQGAEQADHIVDQWKMLYEEKYSAEAAGPSFVGWNSSYTGQPIPEVEMQEWLDLTIDRIRALKPTKILEIGCGAGLLLQHLAPKCSRYVATDFSGSVLKQLRRWISQRADLRHVELLQRSADHLQELEAGAFDTVVLNSVVQYFPDIEYLLAVLREAIRLVGPGGHVFIGDVRHLGLLPMFHSAVQLSKAAATVRVGQLKRRIARALAQEKELVIDPDFFRLLPGRLQGIGTALVSLKRGWAENELTRYRYDVTLGLGNRIGGAAVCPERDWDAARCSVTWLETELRRRGWAAMGLRRIPDGRLSTEAAGYQMMDTLNERLDVGTLRRQISELKYEAVNPEEIWTLAEAHGYEASVSPGERDHFDVRLWSRDPVQLPSAAPSSVSAIKSWGAYANSPLGNGIGQQLIPQLRDALKRQLPEYMIPSSWMLLEQLPMTMSGKVDRRALPNPQQRPDEVGEYVAPETEVERVLADIWAQLLQVDRVGIQDNFFELGGHSLHGMRLIEQIVERLMVRLPPAAVFQYSTVKEMGGIVESLRLLSEDAESGSDEGAELEEGFI